MTTRRELKFSPLTYRIATFDGPRTVRGWAMQLPGPYRRLLRFCIRRDRAGWCVDHYDTGYSFGGPVCGVFCTPGIMAHVKRWACPADSRAACAQWLVRYLRHLERQRGRHAREAYRKLLHAL